jgi:hypothetical protein
MVATSKIKWLGSIILAGTLLVLALLGGKWGTTYSAKADVCEAPVINSISPSSIPTGSPDTTMVITGSQFGNMTDTRVRLTGIGFDQAFVPLQVLPEGISVIIPNTNLVDPIMYLVTVIKSCPGTIPTIPITPYDLESNPVPFFVIGASFIHLPIITNNATH